MLNTIGQTLLHINEARQQKDKAAMVTVNVIEINVEHSIPGLEQSKFFLHSRDYTWWIGRP